MKARTVTAAWGLIVAAAITGVPLALRDRLPDPMAVHWGLELVPDRAASLTSNVLSSLAMWGVLWLSLLGVALHGKVFQRRLGRIYFWGALFGFGVLALGTVGSTLLTNLDAPSWTQARLEGWQVGLVVCAALGAALLAGYLGRGGLDQRPPEGEQPPRLRLRPGQRSAWVSRVANPWLVGLSVAAAAGMVVTGVLELSGVSGGVTLGILPGFVIVLLAGLFTSSLSVRVTQDGLAIGFGPFGWPVRRIRLSKIDRAWSEERYPSQVGGWGFRGLPGSATLMLRGGDCLILRYRSGGQLAISIDDAERGASLINALIAERVAA
ncbi:hypothetical protein ABT294_16040 [Nonomuraea sp. NPDC000554]|uniref:hypothetical protein n=1 Tax=Nonomuraea sp. NPDC000554 TaxID=3154259 RepID=UPI00332E25F3